MHFSNLFILYLTSYPVAFVLIPSVDYLPWTSVANLVRPSWSSTPKISRLTFLHQRMHKSKPPEPIPIWSSIPSTKPSVVHSHVPLSRSYRPSPLPHEFLLTLRQIHSPRYPAHGEVTIASGWILPKGYPLQHSGTHKLATVHIPSFLYSTLYLPVDTFRVDGNGRKHARLFLSSQALTANTPTRTLVLRPYQTFSCGHIFECEEEEVDGDGEPVGGNGQ